MKSKGFIQTPILIIFILVIGSVIAGAFLLGRKSTTPLVFETSETFEGGKGGININIVGEKSEMKEPVEDYNESSWQWLDSQKKLYELTPAEIDLILEEIFRRFPNKSERLKAFAVLRLGTPYQIGCLGEESGRDKDPVFRLDVTDCTAFILTNVALLHSRDLEKAREMMKYLNYRPDSEMTYENRLHFTFDRNMVSPYFRDITQDIAPEDKVITKEIVLNKIKSDSKRLINIDWEKQIILKYIPNKYITENLFSNLPEAVGIAFIKEGDEEIGLDVRHEGLLSDGKILFHATSIEKKVAQVDFFEYYFGKDDSPRFDGVMLFEIK